MDHYSSYPTSLLAKNRRMGVRLFASGAGTRMHRSLVPTPTPAGSLKDLTISISSGQDASLQLVAGSGVSVSHAHARRTMDREEYKLKQSGAQCAAKQLMSWKFFLNLLKYFLDYCMGYDRTRETNLTKEKKMGFDLYSLGNHKTETGEYYRQSVWGWRRLADFVCEQTGVIAEDNKKFWQSNDGHEVSEGEAKEIAKQLKALIKDGTVSKAIREVEEESEQAEKNNKFVEICHKMLREKVERETGKTNTAPADYPKEDHDTWEWIQRKYSYGSSYPFTMEQVESFIEFCEQSNGFRIC